MLLAVPFAAAPATASTEPLDRVALREVLRHQAAAAGTGVIRLPLERSAAGAERGSAAAAQGELARISGVSRRTAVLVGVRRHSQLRGVAATLRRLGVRTESFATIGVIAASAPSGAALAAALRHDGRVAYAERDRPLRIAADPLDQIDPDTGIKFTWFYDDVRAAEALLAAGGGSSRTVAVIDTGLDVNHPEFAGQVARTFDTATRGTSVTDTVGHGTFVSGLIAALDGNGIGGKGVAGATRLIAVRASLDGGFTASDLIRGIDFSIRAGADVLNMSLAGEGFSSSAARALETAFFNDVLPVAASGNRALDGNPVEFPAAVVGGSRGAQGIGLSVAATKPNGGVAAFSTHNRFVSLAAPGAASAGCEFGVLSTLPANSPTEWDDPRSCSRVLSQAGARFAYGEGTSFSAPITSGVAALVWQVEPRLASEQVAGVLTRTARQTLGSGAWNEFTGAGIVDGAAATALARTFDVTDPRARARARRRPGNRVRVAVSRSPDRTEPGRELAGGVRYSLLVSRDGGNDFSALVGRRPRPFSVTVRLRGRRANVLVATACDRNGNCGVRRLGRFRRR